MSTAVQCVKFATQPNGTILKRLNGVNIGSVNPYYMVFEGTSGNKRLLRLDTFKMVPLNTFTDIDFVVMNTEIKIQDTEKAE